MDANDRTHKEHDTDVNKPPPETPSAGALNTTHAPDPMSIQERHQIAVRHIHTVESHNARLYEDNCRLVNAVNMLNDRLAFFGAPQNLQLQRFADVQEKLRASETSRALIHRKYEELLQCSSVAAAQHHLHAELQAIREAYASLNKEYRFLMDSYTRLKAVVSVTDPASTLHAARGLAPVARSEIANTQSRAQSRNSHASPTSAVSPASFRPFVDQNVNDRRRSSDNVTVQPRSGPSPIATSWLAHLPTPPPSAPLPMGQMSPTGFPVHAPMPAASLQLPYLPQMSPSDPRNLLPSLPVVAQSQHLMQQGPSEQLTTAAPLRRRSGESTNMTYKDPVSCTKETPAPASLTSSPRQLKRSSTELQTCMSPGGEYKKSRIQEEAGRSTTIDAHTHPTNKIPASTHLQNDIKSSGTKSTVERSYQDSVDIIFEKDADVEDGVFCGLCLDRFEAKMIPEPPDVLIQPNFDFLVRHCMTEHPTAWNDLRTNKA